MKKQTRHKSALQSFLTQIAGIEAPSRYKKGEIAEYDVK
jgi:hypothetical protein